MTELLLGSCRVGQLLLSIVTLGISSAAVHGLSMNNTGGFAPNRFAVFASLWSLLCLLFLVTSQFLFVHQYNGYSVYMTTGVLLELSNSIFVFAIWVAMAQYGSSPNCQPSTFGRRLFPTICDLDKALVAFSILLWLLWVLSLGLMIKLKISERKDQKTSKEIELRIKQAVETQTSGLERRENLRTVSPQQEEVDITEEKM